MLNATGYRLGEDPAWARVSFKWILRTAEDKDIALDMLGHELNGTTIGMVEICDGPYLKEQVKLPNFVLSKD